MAIQYGPFPAGINKGYEHYDTVSGGQFRYVVGDPRDVLSWLLVGGELLEQPDTLIWNMNQRGARWFNKTENGFFGWNGEAIVYLG